MAAARGGLYFMFLGLPLQSFLIRYWTYDCLISVSWKILCSFCILLPALEDSTTVFVSNNNYNYN